MAAEMFERRQKRESCPTPIVIAQPSRVTLQNVGPDAALAPIPTRFDAVPMSTCHGHTIVCLS